LKSILTIVGARPQFIKAATLSRQFKKVGIEEKILHTGQHFDPNMSDVFFEEMQIPKPNHYLDIHSLSHGAMTGRMLESIEKIMMEDRPEGVLVYGDTNSTIAGALAASKLHIPVIHVEAGLRSFNMKMPEEVNRVLTDRISSLLFCPTDAAVKNLSNEGFNQMPCQIIKNGDVMQDAAIFYAGSASKKSTIIRDLILKSFVLSTIHRQENTDNIENLQSIIEGLEEINNQVQVVMPVHPRTRQIITKSIKKPNFLMIDPIGYFDMISLLSSCELVITDSGGVQKEAFFFQKNCITLRDQTEWTELVENGFNILVGSNKQKLLEAFGNMTNMKSDFSIDLYGKGNASEKAAQAILKF
jgi:UDP-GlcNAc3NAcA epimerase